MRDNNCSIDCRRCFAYSMTQYSTEGSIQKSKMGDLLKPLDRNGKPGRSCGGKLVGGLEEEIAPFAPVFASSTSHVFCLPSLSHSLSQEIELLNLNSYSSRPALPAPPDLFSRSANYPLRFWLSLKTH